MNYIKEKCVLCGNKELLNKQTIKISLINKLYKNNLDIDITTEFKQNSKINFVECTNCHLHFFTPVCAGSPNFYEDLQKATNFYYKNDRYEFLFAKEQIKNTDCVLEIGAGNASFAETLNVKEYIGLEYNEKAIESAKRKGIKLINQSIQDYALEKQNYFDVVCSFQVLEHVPDVFEFIDAALKTIKKGGLLIFGVPSAESILTSNINHTLNLPPHHISRWYDKTLKKLPTIFNVDIVDINHEPLSDKFSKRYKINKISEKIYNTFLKKNIVISNNKSISFIQKTVKKLVNKFNLMSSFNKDDKYGESVIFILKKNE